MEKQSEKRLFQKSKINTYQLLCVLILALITLNVLLGGAYFYLNHFSEGSRSINRDNSFYDKHFVMITGKGNEEFWSSVYTGALEMGNLGGAYVERMGDNVSNSYDSMDLLRIAIAEKVDGIMLEYTGEEAMDELIAQAARNGIPLVTLLRDEPSGKRISFVGVSYYNLGQQYAEQIVDLMENRYQNVDRPINIYLLMDSQIADTARNIVYSTIQDTLAARELHHNTTILLQQIDESSPFKAEEDIRQVFMDAQRLPDIIVCLDETSSISVYQILIDYNQVGRVEELAYFTNPTILKGVQKRIIHSTTSIDTVNIGKNAVEALLEYHLSSYVSDYYSVDTYTIDHSNIDSFIEEKSDEK